MRRVQIKLISTACSLLYNGYTNSFVVTISVIHAVSASFYRKVYRNVTRVVYIRTDREPPVMCTLYSFILGFPNDVKISTIQ